MIVRKFLSIVSVFVCAICSFLPHWAGAASPSQEQCSVIYNALTEEEFRGNDVSLGNGTIPGTEIQYAIFNYEFDGGVVAFVVNLSHQNTGATATSGGDLNQRNGVSVILETGRGPRLGTLNGKSISNVMVQCRPAS